LRVHHGGPPIPDELRPILFEPFRRSRRSRRASEGLGLGLYITRELVEAHGGTLTLQSSEDAGTTFLATLPRDRHVSSASPTSADPARDTPRDRADKTILLVEDEPAARLALTDLLESEGYRILVAATGLEAVEKAADHARPIDLLVTDIRLPGIGGNDLAEHFREIHPTTQVILMSGFDPPAGDWAFVQKPIDLDALIGAIDRALFSQDSGGSGQR
jgi:CheY-like chemotaxis protein